MLILNVVSHRNERVSLSRAPFLDTSSRAFRNYQHVIFNWYQQPQTYSCFVLSLVEKQEKNLAFTEEEMAWRHLSTVESLFSVSLLCNILTSLVPSLTNPWPSKTFELDEKSRDWRRSIWRVSSWCAPAYVLEVNLTADTSSRQEWNFVREVASTSLSPKSGKVAD